MKRNPAWISALKGGKMAASVDAEQGVPSIEEERGVLHEIHSPAAPTVDIIAIHGLNGDWKSTWTVEHETQEAFWLKDFLPLDIPEARILSFSYDSRIAFNRSIKMIESFSEHLLGQIIVSRREDEGGNRPLFFICHSLGGIVAKETLIMANNHRYDPSAQSIFKATKGILFFGTPHKGSKNTTFGSYISSIVDIVTPKGAALTEQYVALKKDGESLKQISETFIGLCKEIRILTRFETRTKFSQITVDRDSAVLGVPNEICVGMERTHQDLCRFKSRDGALYKAVISDIKEILKPKKEDSPHGARGSVVYNNDYTNAKVGQSNMVGEVSGGDLNLGTGSTFNFN